MGAEEAYEGPLINDCRSKSGRPYRLSKPGQGLHVGNKPYSDWSCSFAHVPRWLQGSAYVQVPMEDRNLQGDADVSLMTNTRIRVYLGLNPKMKTPQWVTRSFTRTHSRLVVTINKDPAVFVVCRANDAARAGTVFKLGGMKYMGQGTCHNYCLILRPEPVVPKVCMPAWVGLGWIGFAWIGFAWVGLGWVGLGWVCFALLCFALLCFACVGLVSVVCGLFRCRSRF